MGPALGKGSTALRPHHSSSGSGLTASESWVLDGKVVPGSGCGSWHGVGAWEVCVELNCIMGLPHVPPFPPTPVFEQLMSVLQAL